MTVYEDDDHAGLALFMEVHSELVDIIKSFAQSIVLDGQGPVFPVCVDVGV